MRILVAGAVALSLSACFGGGGEPLSSLGERSNRQPTTTRGSGSGADDRAPLTVREQAVENLRLAVQQATVQAYASAQAGVAHDRFSAQQAAASLASAVELVHERAATIQSIDNENAPQQDCGCEPCAGGGDVVATDPDVEDAVNVSALALDAANGVANALNVDDVEECTESCGCEGCDTYCTTVPGQVDEGDLNENVDDANTAAGELEDVDSNLGDALLG